jgi:hypothetical protein
MLKNKTLNAIVMKSTLSLTSALAFCILFSSCIKSLDVTVSQTNPVSGSWYISDASAYDGYGWYSFDAGTPGVFTFYDNGNAQYSDDYGTMQGSWHMDLVSTGYYNSNGVFQTDMHNNFQFQVSDGYGNNIDLYFDDISFAGNNQFIATYYDGKHIQRFTFTRY